MNEETYAEKFDKKYADKGGVNELLRLYDAKLKNPEIAEYFDLSEEGITHALKKILGKDYMAWLFRKGVTRPSK
jgi:hypothetical protein